MGALILAVIFLVMTVAMAGVMVMAFPEFSFGGPALVALLGFALIIATAGMIGVLVIVVSLGAFVSLITGGLGGGD
jgi:hypothetical protein